jgi:hypothetical protein
MIEDRTIEIFVVVPPIEQMSFEILSVCLDFLERYQKLTILCSDYEYGFYRTLIKYSITFSKQSNLEIDFCSRTKLREIQQKRCLIISLHKDTLYIENQKQAICCSIDKCSDIIFEELNLESNSLVYEYIRALKQFLKLPDTKKIPNIDISADDFIATSQLTAKLREEKYSFIILHGLIETFKANSLLRKNQLVEKLVIVSNHSISSTDPHIVHCKKINLLDYVAIHLQARNICIGKAYPCRNILNNMRVGLYVNSMVKDLPVLIKDISVPRAK